MEKQGMKAIYFNSQYQFDVIEINEHETVICTSLEELTQIKQRTVGLISRLNKAQQLEIALREAHSKGLISKRLAKELKGLL